MFGGFYVEFTICLTGGEFLLFRVWVCAFAFGFGYFNVKLLLGGACAVVLVGC